MAGEMKVITKYATKGGAVVQVFGNLPGPDYSETGFKWVCGGCGHRSGNDLHRPTNESADKHGLKCRALPLN
ncbi:hypothetical protein ACFCXP_37600 [Streptomyces niveus]|uniref:hypothetical protein n=1 Tax=Streptomyces niveus TaxID=193462 RepID=UPI0035DEAD73